MVRIMSIAGVLVLLLPLAAVAQRGAGRMNQAHMYNPATEETVQGTVQRVDSVPSPMGWTGIHLQVQTDDGVLPVHLGPSWYIANQEVQIEEGDEVEVVGSRITYEGAPALVAATVQRSDHLLVLRDGAGFPAWRGWRQGRRGGRGMGRGMGPGRGLSPNYGRLYDASTVETVSGTVAEVERLPMGRAFSVRLHLDADDAPTIFLGPSWYLDNQDVVIPEGATVIVTGSRVTIDGDPVILAASVTYDDQVLTLRDASGLPVWSGWRQR